MNAELTQAMSEEEFQAWACRRGPNSGLSRLQKAGNFMALAAKRDGVMRKNPQLRKLFFELTDACNERCLHCGSRCGEAVAPGSLTLDEYRLLIDQLARDFGTDLHLCITGGEPLLRPDFFDIMGYAKGRGFGWGMTSNGTLITPQVARDLYAAGMRTISVSIDGLEESHEWFRRSPGSFRRTVEGVRSLVAAAKGRHVQVTTCVNRRNLGELPQLHQMMLGLDVTSWRVINVEPIGRALDEPDLLLTGEEYRRMLDFIKERRFAAPRMPVVFGCSHYLGIDLEREVRDWHFMCHAGLTVASISSTGDILACLDIERRPELVQGNIRQDRLKDVWRDGFEVYRTDFRKTGMCAECWCYDECAGDSFHTWDFDKMEPRMCPKGVLF